MRDWIVNLPRNAKRTVSLSVDLVILPSTLWLAFCLRLEHLYIPDHRVMSVMFLTTVLSAFIFVRLGLYRAVLRFAGPQLFNTLFLGVSISVLAFAFFGFLLQASIPRSVPFIYFTLAFLVIGGSRIFARHLLNSDTRRGKEAVIIYGAGSAGLQLATALGQGVEYSPVAFLDDDKQKQGMVFHGLKVYKPAETAKIVRATGATLVLLAMGAITVKQRSKIIEIVSEFGVKVQTIPGFADIVSGKAKIQELRDVKIEELLGRDPVPPRQDLLDACVRDKVVMVTGAGGSIGSELCRQVIAGGAKKLILFELSEFALYKIEMELIKGGNADRLVSYLGNCQDQEMLETIMKDRKVQTVYHAAAYKHVPLVEHNVISGARNNIFGTLNTAMAATNMDVENFLLISTDKAVRPTNFMGATKRFAEIILQNLSLQSETKTKFSMVRFGNVLGSSGSVVPLFTDQITNSGRVTVTHPEITRYFMTIPEAVQLVIQASAMSKGGDVFVLDMGEPVKITLLAETMIRLLGKSIKNAENPDGDIEIQFTGLRPGEKLYEELLIGENCVGTEHPMITRAMEATLETERLADAITRLKNFCGNLDSPAVLALLENTVDGYARAEVVFDNHTNHA